MATDEDAFTPEEQAQAERLDQQIDARLQALPFLPPDERPASDPLLLQAVARFYQPEAEEIQRRLQRARERVEQRGAQALMQQRRRVTPLLRMKSLRERQDQMKPPWHLWRGTIQRSSLLASMVGLLFVFLLVGSLVVGVILTRHSIQTVEHPQPSTTAAGTLAPNPTATPNPPPTETPIPTRIPPPVSQVAVIQMFDVNTGWATTTENHVLRTTDGANHWQDVTPAEIDPFQGGASNLLHGFLSPSLAWVASFMRNGPNGSDSYQGVTNFFLTTDAGQHWSWTMLHGYLPVQIVFTDSQHGWMLNNHGFDGSGGNAADVFRTSDGGATWNKVASAGPTTGNRSGVLPYTGAKTGIGALNASTAWVTGGLDSNLPWLYVTHDSGATWQRQTLGLPAGAPPELSVSTVAPIFFNAQDGILPAWYSSTMNSPLMYFYVTHNGGASWKSTTLVGADYFQGAGLDFLTVNQGWVSFRALLFVTSDGGQHWTQLPQSSALEDVSGMSFVSNEVGWAIDLADGALHLVKTTDGGRTWRAVPFP